MTDDEKGRLFLRMKQDRDNAKGDLCLARKAADILQQRLSAAGLALGHEAARVRERAGLEDVRLQ